jgi:hypothetical protein
MKKIILLMVFLFISTSSYAQCVAEIKEVIQDPLRGSVVVVTEYKLNGQLVQTGETRYLESSGTENEIKLLIKADVQEHCENLIKRIPENTTYLNTQKLLQQKALTQPIVTNLNSYFVGYKITVSEVMEEFKGKDINVTYDKENSISDSGIVIEP